MNYIHLNTDTGEKENTGEFHDELIAHQLTGIDLLC